jgi:hypothetical protein
MLAGRVSLKLGQQVVHLLPFIIVLWNSNGKAKPSGLADSNFIFFVATKKGSTRKLGCTGQGHRLPMSITRTLFTT